MEAEPVTWVIWFHVTFYHLKFLTGFSAREITMGPRCMSLHFESEGSQYFIGLQKSSFMGSEVFLFC